MTATGEVLFERDWKPLLGFVVLIGFGSQAIIPYVAPFDLFLLVILMGVFYHMAWENYVGGKKVSRVRDTLGTAVGLAILFLSMGILTEVVGTLDQIAEPCTKLRMQLLKKPNSTAADVYSALHCPPFFNLPQLP